MFLITTAAAAMIILTAPVLDQPTTIRLGTGPTITKLDPGKDYVLVMPSVRKQGSTVIIGGRNVVIKGGLATVVRSDPQRRAFYIKDVVGTIHIEGVLIDNTDGGEFDAFAISAPAAIVQLQRIRVDGLVGTRKGFHSDVIQPWGGVRELRVNYLTASSNYQGIQLPDMSGGAKTGLVTLSNVNLKHYVASRSGSESADDRGGYLLWTIRGNNCAFKTRIKLNDVYIAQSPKRSANMAAWPDAKSSLPCAARVSADKSAVDFPALPITGAVHLGSPNKGDFVPAASVGLRYQAER